MSSTFILEDKSDYAIIKCPAEMDHRAAKELATASTQWLGKSCKLFVFDFHHVITLDTAVFRPFVLFHQSLKKAGGVLFTINVSHAVFQTIHSGGVASVFSPKANLSEALSAAGIKVQKSIIDVNFVNPFIKATVNTLSVQANTKLKAGKPFLKDDKNALNTDIAGVISLTSNVFQGSIALCFPAKVFLAIYSNMIGEKHETITKEIEDAAGELLNIIFGQAKAELNDNKAFSIQKAIPTVIKGSALSVHHTTRRAALVLPFETDAGVFHVEISAESTD